MVEADREQVKQSLLTKAEECFAQWDNLDVVLEDASIGYIAKQKFEDDGNAITLVKYRAEGLTTEHLQPFFDNPTSVFPILNNRMTVVDLPEHQGQKMYHFKMNMPMILSNRSIITTFYNSEKDGGRIIMNSSQGNEAQIAALADEIGSDVVATMIIGYWWFKPFDGGYEIQQINASDPAGMIPGFVKSKMAGRMANGLMLTIDYLKNGTIPTAMF